MAHEKCKPATLPTNTCNTKQTRLLWVGMVCTHKAHKCVSLSWFVQRRNKKWISVLLGTLDICVFCYTFRDFHKNVVFLSFVYETHQSLNAHIPATRSSSRRLSSWSPSFTLSRIPFYCLSYSAKTKSTPKKVTSLKRYKKKYFGANMGTAVLQFALGMSFWKQEFV